MLAIKVFIDKATHCELEFFLLAVASGAGYQPTRIGEAGPALGPHQLLQQLSAAGERKVN